MITAFLVFIFLLHRKLLSKIPFTLHLYGVIWCIWDVYGGEGCFWPFTHPSPSSFFRKTHYISNGSVIYYGQLQSSMMAELRYKVKGGWRVGEGLKAPFTSRNPSVYRGFRRKGEGWRVKSRVGFLQAKTTFLTARMLRANGSGRQVEIFLPTYHFVPGNGKKLPQ